MKVVKNKQTGNRLDKFSGLKGANDSESHSTETWELTAAVSEEGAESALTAGSTSL